MPEPVLALNLLLRGGSMAVLALIAFALWRDHPRALAARLGSGFAVSVAAATLASMPGFAAAPEGLRTVVAALAAGSMFIFWLFTRSLFDDAFALRAWHALAWAALASIGIHACHAQVFDAGAGPTASSWLLTLSPVVWSALAIAQSLAEWHNDLVERRRRLRTLVIALTAFYTVAQLIAALGTGLTMKAVVESTASAAVTAVLSLFFGWQLLRAGHSGLLAAADEAGPARTDAADFQAAEFRTGIPAVAAQDPPASAARGSTARPEPGEVPDRRQVAALEALMTVEHFYREPSLTIGVLAERMALPEYRLRRLINQGLGHRNFSSFLNAFRLADARRWLADPAQAGTPILTIAMDAGFQSLGPFNRAFKADTGMTPSEFRRRAGAGADVPVQPAPAAGASVGLADSEIG